MRLNCGCQKDGTWGKSAKIDSEDDALVHLSATGRDNSFDKHPPFQKVEKDESVCTWAQEDKMAVSRIRLHVSSWQSDKAKQAVKFRIRDTKDLGRSTYALHGIS